MNDKRVLLYVLVFALFLVACGATELDTTSPAPTEEAVVETTAVVPISTEEAVVEPTVEPVEEVSQTAVSDPTADVVTEVEETSEVVTFQLEAWGDNWFAAYLEEALIVEDSVSITTERSFNAETAVFTASYPLQLNFILKDFKENDTGLEYIGANNQQMGDGGFIMQLTDTSTGEVVVVSDDAFVCLVVHEAPLDKSCENESNPVAGTAPCEYTETPEPDGWMLADFDDSSWPTATVHTSADVDPKQGYKDISWDSSAQFIWGPDLETNNTLLCRVTVDAP